MTTIVWDGRFLATDSQSTNNNSTITSTSTKKIYTPENGELWKVNNKKIVAMAYCGVSGAEIELINKMILGIHYDTEYTSVSSFTAMCICNDGSGVNIYKNEKESQALLQPFTGCKSIGSGSEYAITVIKMGYSAVKAVEMAITLDIYSGGEVQTFEVIK